MIQKIIFDDFLIFELYFKSKSMDTTNKEIVELMIEYIRKTVFIMESGFYDYYSSMGRNSETISILCTSSISLDINKFIIGYLNKTYRSIILRDDEYTNSIFDKINGYGTHSLVCILLLIAEMFKVLFMHTNRRLYNTTSYPEYMSSVALQLLILTSTIKSSVNLSHSCKGENIYNLDPDKPLFSITPIKKD